jgi:hypothetical protein
MTVLYPKCPIDIEEKQIADAAFATRQEQIARYEPPPIRGELTEYTRRLNELLDNEKQAGLLLSRVIDCKRDCPADPSSLVGLEAAIRALREYKSRMGREYSELIVRGKE